MCGYHNKDLFGFQDKID